MQTSLIDKLSRFNPKHPYVWELKITENEFCSLEKDLCSYTHDASKKDDALKILVYIAEWYKRKYTNRAKKDYQKTFGSKKPDLKTVWSTLGIDEQYLYKGENNQELHLYSTFILSGLSIQFELQKNEKPFLKSLCRVFNGEEDNYEVDTNHSIAFKESVRRRHCLDSFLIAILKNINSPAELPFAIEDYNNADTRIKELTKLIKEINDSVQRSKFRLEWVFNAPHGDDLISRHLRLWLNPNNGDVAKRHVFAYEDIREKWGVAKTEEQRYIRIGLNFLSQIGSHEAFMVKRADSVHPACMFRNTGERYFIASEPDYAVVKDIPITYFNQVQIVCWDDEGNEYPIVTEDVKDAVQLYRIEKYEDLWTDRALPQRETVVLFSDKYHIADESDDKIYENKTLYYKKYGEGDIVHWCPVNIAVLLKDENNKQLDFVNKQTSNSISIHLYKESIVYSSEGKLTWIKKDIESEEEEEDSICLITKKEDISVRFYSNNNSEDDEDNIEIIPPETIKLKSTNGHYIEWTDDCAPKYGVNYIRVYARHQLINQNEVFPVFYLPEGICRDCDARQISYISEKGLKILIDDNSEIQTYIDRKQVLPVSKTIILKNGEENSLILPIIRPLKLKEIIYDNRILDYVKEGAYELPYILHNHIVLHSYGEIGYKEYNCAFLTGVHKLIKEKRPNNPNAAWASSAAWENGDTYEASIIDVNAPDFLRVKIGERMQMELNNEEFYFWDYDQDHPLIKMPRRGVTAPDDWGIVFQSNKRNRTGKNYYPLYNEEDDDIFDDDSDDHFENVSIIQCFKIAIEHELYFFTLTPLKNLSEEEFNKQLLLPILKEYDGTPPPDICNGLMRFVEEYDYQDKDKYYSKINQKTYELFRFIH